MATEVDVWVDVVDVVDVGNGGWWVTVAMMGTCRGERIDVSVMGVRAAFGCARAHTKAGFLVPFNGDSYGQP